MDVLSGGERNYQTTNEESKHDAIFPVLTAIFYSSHAIIKFIVLSLSRGAAPGASHEKILIKNNISGFCKKRDIKMDKMRCLQLSFDGFNIDLFFVL